MNKLIGHYRTIHNHKKLVMRHCFRCGLYWQGLTHDLSKLNPVEFIPGVKYYQGGKRSPNNGQREAEGCSTAWLHHKGRNKHHLEYWIDYSMDAGGMMTGMEMPVKYVVEMVCDRIAASKNYQGADYTQHHPLVYYNRGRDRYLLHPNTKVLMETLLTMLDQQGEDAMFDYIRREVLHNKR